MNNKILEEIQQETLARERKQALLSKNRNVGINSARNRLTRELPKDFNKELDVPLTQRKQPSILPLITPRKSKDSSDDVLFEDTD